MTKHLYYTDSYLREFSGIVLEKRTIENKPAAILNQTAFYPTSGGQPHDTGMLQDARVMDVLEDDSGAILHILDREIRDEQVTGQIDWARRFDHMQQHTGQHILSQAFLAVACAQTLSFHMGPVTSTIDIELAQPSPSQMEEAQSLATRIVFENRNVYILSTDRANIESMGIRKESQREGEIRIVDIEGFDRSACGGTHVRRTGEIGMVFVLDYERYKGGTRVEFVAGGRALKQFHSDHVHVNKLGRAYSAAPENLPGLTEKLLQDRIALSRENERLQDQLMDMEAAELLKSAPVRKYAVVRKVYTDRSLDKIKVLAQKLTAQPDVLAVLCNADACQLVVARSRNLAGNCNDAIKKAAAELGGKGGGKPELAQAGGFPANTLDAWLQSLENYFLST